MAKNKEQALDYEIEKLKRILVRKGKRKERHKQQQEEKRNPKCDCGYWCFCGSNTPGVIDY